ncbi:tyrosine-type recombinase/integrase [Mesorhizobium sp.]|uniref:tyrosine-type recombinase/integrase n=1 Tax=Mesorhizobium sp. TaxID=1871066 RepID=UPI00121B698D|nr:tyrosine-type recombinase/integrase [Mesorhizobium sp.]TIL40232.1 MAG: hypothetical protein E5Y82_06870 [Mesorhizobium sp.]
MGLILKYAQEMASGSWRYRRRVPDDLKAIVGKTEITIHLGQTRKDALKQWQKADAEYDRLITAAKRKAAGLPAEKAPTASRLLAFIDAQKEVRAASIIGLHNQLNPDDAEGDDLGREVWAESIVSKYPVDDETGDPVGVSDEDSALVRLLLNRNEPAPAPTLDDAARIYLNEKNNNADPQKKRKQEQRVHRIVGHAKAALGGNVVLTSLKKSDARAVRDYLLDDLDMTPATARRYLNDLKAAIVETFDQCDIDLKSPFSGLKINIEGADLDKRRPFTQAELKQVRSAVMAGANDELRLIWRILEGTGCRIAEVSGLELADVNLNVERPYLDLHPNKHRGLKTKASKRWVPLVGDALLAAEQALALPHEGKVVFPRYGKSGGAGNVSQILMRYVRGVTTDPLVTVHSLRHNLKDLLIRAKAMPLAQDLILGHANGGLGERVYGGMDSRLEVTTEAMRAAWGERTPSLAERNVAARPTLHAGDAKEVA